MGKYDEVMVNLPKFENTDTAYQDRVNVHKSELVNAHAGQFSATELAQRWTQLRAHKDELEEKLSDLNFELECIAQLTIDAFDECDTRSVRLTDGTTVTSQPEPYSVVKDRDMFRLWCLSQGLERSLQLPWQTTNSLVKNRLLQGQGAPPGVEAYVRDKLVRRTT